MPFAILKNDKTLEALVLRLFSKDGKLSSSTANHAATALMKANPRLNQMSNMPKGSMIVIPPTDLAMTPSQVVPAPPGAFFTAIAAEQQSLKTLAGRLAEISDRAHLAAKSLDGLPKSENKAFESIPGVDEFIKLHNNKGPKKTKVVQADVKARKEAFAVLQDHVASMLHR